MVENIHITVSGVCVPSGVVDGNQSFERKYYLSLYSEKNFYVVRRLACRFFRNTGTHLTSLLGNNFKDCNSLQL